MATSNRNRPQLESPDVTLSVALDQSAVRIEQEGAGQVVCQWKPTGASRIELLVMQGDLTRCKVDAIVNAANRHLMHGGGLAKAIICRGGLSIQRESSQWIADHGALPVGDAVTTTAGKLPCKHVIHTVGPNVKGTTLTLEHATKLHQAVWSALMEAHRMKVNSVAIPGISTGIFGYPRILGASEIVKEAIRFCKEKGETTTIKQIVLMSVDSLTVESFAMALRKERERQGVVEKGISEELAKLNLNE